MPTTVRARSWTAALRLLWTELRLRAGSLVLVGYAAVGSAVGIEVFALVAVWPVGVGLLVVGLFAGLRVRRRATARARRPA